MTLSLTSPDPACTLCLCHAYASGDVIARYDTSILALLPIPADADADTDATDADVPRDLKSSGACNLSRNLSNSCIREADRYISMVSSPKVPFISLLLTLAPDLALMPSPPAAVLLALTLLLTLILA